MTKEQNGSDLTFEAAYLGIDPRVLREGRDHIQALISMGFAIPVKATDSKRVVVIDEKRDPGETETIFTQEEKTPEKLVGCILPDRDSHSILVIDYTNLKMGLFEVKPLWSGDSFPNHYFDPDSICRIGVLNSDLINYFKNSIYFITTATSEGNPDLVSNKLEEFVPKIKAQKDLSLKNRNSVAENFVREMGRIC